MGRTGRGPKLDRYRSGDRCLSALAAMSMEVAMSDGGAARRLAERTLRTCLHGMLLAATAVGVFAIFASRSGRAIAN